MAPDQNSSFPSAAAPLRTTADPYPIATRLHGVPSSAVRDLLRYAQQPGMISLAGGLPAPELFDVEGLRDAADAALTVSPVAALQYGVTDGQPSLKAQLVELMAGRGAPVTAEQLVVTTGSQQGIDLLARVLLDPGDTVIVERPAYLAALQTFGLAQARLETVDGDEHGARIADLDGVVERVRADGGVVKLVYLVANFANPSGATLSRERRLELARFAARQRIFVVEDDPYGELRSFGEVVPSLLALARTVPGAEPWCGYLSTLSKILSPGLRIGWLALPPALANHVVVCKQGHDLHTSTLTQEIAARYLASGRLAARMPVIRDAYRARNEALAAALERHLGGRIVYNRPEGGMFLWARIAGIDSSVLLRAAIDQKVIFVPGTSFFAQAPDVSTLRLSFATPAPSALDEAVQRLARALERMPRI